MLDNIYFFCRYYFITTYHTYHTILHSQENENQIIFKKIFVSFLFRIKT